MRILLYTQEFPPQRGGAGTYTFDLANALSAIGHEVLVVAPYCNRTAKVPQGAENVRVVRLARWQESGFGGAYVLRREWLRFRPDVVLVTERLALEWAARRQLAFFRYGVFLHGTEMWWAFDRERSRIARRVRRRVGRFLQRADLLLVGSEATRQLVLDYLPTVSDKLRLVRLGVDVGRMHRAAREEVEEVRRRWKLGDRKVVLCVARMAEDKGHDVLIRAFKIVTQSVPDALLMLVGSGPLKSKMEELAHRLGIDESVCFAGEVTDSQLAAHFEACDVFAMVSTCQKRWEGFGLVFIEANLHEKPVLAGAVGGVPEAVEDGVTGLLVGPHDTDGAARALHDLLTDENACRRMGVAGKRRAEECFGAKRMAEETADALASIPSSERGSRLGHYLALTRDFVCALAECVISPTVGRAAGWCLACAVACKRRLKPAGRRDS